MDDNIENLKFPVGKYFPETPIAKAHLEQWKATIKNFPLMLKSTLEKFNDKDYQTPYRPGGWTGLQVVHHLADSHMNSYIRFKLGITEDNPVIKPYKEALWAELEDGKNLPALVSVNIIENVHLRWSVLLNTFTDDQWKRMVHHPESKRDMTLAYLLGLYDWHCRHHLAHLKLIKS